MDLEGNRLNYFHHKPEDHDYASMRRRVVLLESAIAEIALTGHYKNAKVRLSWQKALLELYKTSLSPKFVHLWFSGDDIP